MEDHEPGPEEVLPMARTALRDFKDFVKEEYPKASSLYEGAKNLYDEIRAHWTRDKNLVHKGEWSPDQFDQDLKQVAEQQKETWNQLLEAVKLETARVKTVYEKVEAAEKLVLHARGEGPHVAWMGIGTKEQDEIRKVYSHELRQKFHDAKMEMNALIGYPDGLLVKVEMCLQQANKETEHLSGKLHKHPRGGLMAQVPFIK